MKSSPNTVEPCYNILLGIQEKNTLYQGVLIVREFLFRDFEFGKSTLYQGVLYKEVLYSEGVLYVSYLS